MISEVEKLGIEILHVSTDNHATNTKMFRILKKKYKKPLRTYFNLIGLNSKFTSVVGYFLVANLTAEQQTTLCLHVISEVEKLGIEILHVSTDSHATNTKKFRMLKKIF